MKKTAKKAAKRPLARKVEATHREREGKQKKKRLPPHVEEDAPPPPELANPVPEDIVMGWGPELASQAQCEGGAGSMNPLDAGSAYKKGYEAGLRDSAPDIRSNLARTMEGYRESYSPEGTCGDMVALILGYRSLDEIETFVYDKTGKAYPGCNNGHRRMNCGNVIRGLVSRRDTETMAWLLDTKAR